MSGHTPFGQLVGTTSAETKELPKVAQLDALHGWRLAKLYVSKNDIRLTSLNYYDWELKAEMDAVCKVSSISPPEHVAPQLKCSCGFYAVKDRTDEQVQNTGTGRVLLEVDLSGLIIECSNGFRAAHQRIIALWLPGTCMNGFLCQERATHILLVPPKERQYWDIVRPDQYLNQFNQYQWGPSAGRVAVTSQGGNELVCRCGERHLLPYQPVVVPRQTFTDPEIISTCTEHLKGFEHQAATPAKLTSYLGIEVRFETDGANELV